MRTCDAIGCTAQVPTGRFMCTKHWHLVPAATQRVIHTRYRAANSGHALLRDKRYVGACAAAIEGIAQSEGKAENVNTYRRLLNLLEHQEPA